MRCTLFRSVIFSLVIALFASFAAAGRSYEPEYKRRAAKLGPRNVRGHFVLALWCAQKKMTGRAWKHHAIVLDVQPKHRASLRAHKTLRPNTKALVREALSAPNLNIRNGAVRALRRTPRPVASILPALHAKSARTRLRAIRTLGLLGHESAVAPLILHVSESGGSTTGAYISTGSQHSYVQDFDVEVA